MAKRDLELKARENEQLTQSLKLGEKAAGLKMEEANEAIEERTQEVMQCLEVIKEKEGELQQAYEKVRVGEEALKAEQLRASKIEAKMKECLAETKTLRDEREKLGS